MATWNPQPEGLAELVELFRQSTSTERDVQRRIAQRLDAISQIPDYVNYLVLVFVQMPQEDVSTRSVAGLLAKNHLYFNYQRVSPESLEYVKSLVLPALAFPDTVLRNVASQLVSVLVQVVKPANWIGALETLTNMMDSASTDEAEAALSTLAKISEDIPEQLDACEINGVRPLDVLIPKLLHATAHSDTRIRVHALNALNQYIQIGSPSMSANVDAYVAALFQRASDERPVVRKFVCKALVFVLSTWPEKLAPEMSNLVEYMLYSTQDKDEDVALEAAEFWLQFAEETRLADQLRPYLPRVIPVLLQCMVYSELSLLMLGETNDDAAQPDRPEDIKPRHYGGTTHRSEHVAADDAAGAGAPTHRSRAAIDAEFDEEQDEDEDEDEDDDDDDFDDDDTLGSWNLRKCSAAALDVLAVHFHEEILPTLLPLLKERLFSEDWIQREAGILALGAIAEGCMAGIEPHLPTLVPMLLNMLHDKQPLVRSITCWTLGRYSSWFAGECPPEHLQQFFVPTLEGLLAMVLDNNKRVQEAGCSAFATLEEEVGATLAPYLGPVLQTLVLAFDRYHQKNMLILYDAVGTLADSVGAALNEPQYIEVLMAPLTAKWTALDDTDPDLIPLLECLASVTIAMGPGFAPHALPVYQRCVSIIHANLAAYEHAAAHPDPDAELPDRTFLIVALDLLSGLSQGLGPSMAELVANGQPPLLAQLQPCLTNVEPPVRQSAYALLGDLAISAFAQLRPYLPVYLPLLLAQIDPEQKHETLSVCNNATWAAGEIALQYGRDDPELHPWIPELLAKLIAILRHPKSVKSLSENAAVTIGRLGLVAPHLVAPHLAVFLEPWCQALWDIKDNDEKDSAFQGLCEMIRTNPNGATQGFAYFCNAVVRWQKPSAALNERFAEILHGFRQMSGEKWGETKAQFPPVIQQRLGERYGV
ncbi:hypothetical protein MOBT1_002573 [Malassezia obtusa]|uniref:Dynein axonemal assembly factor 5 TPR repeats domain-containing protein n=1 Tax=Malassezia obtusa TaxID=76774 RepID=A0AAF0E2J1_9BASI|nr:hypothetical protein MOBT1_002573 [Malassezia obtusa]